MADLDRFLDAVRYLTVGRPREAIEKVLIAGCGFCDECGALAEMFPSAVVTAIDILESNTRRTVAMTAEISDRVTAIQGNLAWLRKIAPGPYDLIVVRHPNLDEGTKNWRDSLKACIHELSAEGLMIISIYSLMEATTANQLVKAAGASLRVGSPYTSKPVALQGNDRYILAYGS